MDNKFEVGEFYMSQYAMDVCIEVLNVTRGSKGITKLEVYYWNLGYTGRPWKIKLDSEEIRIHDKELDTWHHIDYDVLVQPRFMGGLPGVPNE